MTALSAGGWPPRIDETGQELSTMNDITAEMITDRIARKYSDEIEGFDLRLETWNEPDPIMRLRLSPKDASWVVDVGPAFKDNDCLKAFLRGLELSGGDLEQKATPYEGDQ